MKAKSAQRVVLTFQAGLIAMPDKEQSPGKARGPCDNLDSLPRLGLISGSRSETCLQPSPCSREQSRA